MEPKVILVDEHDHQIGITGKLDAHQNGGKLHRSISIFVFNSKGQTMLQQRASTKYHASDQWSNTTCSHPGPGESVLDAAHRRLKEEMGFDCNLKEVFTFIYDTPVGSGLTEHEFDHVFFGTYDGMPKLNPEEVRDWKWVGLDDLKKDMAKNPNLYTPWSKIAIDLVIKQLKKKA